MIGMFVSLRPPSMASDGLSSAAPEQRKSPRRKAIGAQIIESFWTDAGRGAEALKLRNDHATIGELIERNQQRAAQRPATISSNVRPLRMIMQVVHSGDPDESRPRVSRSGFANSREASGQRTSTRAAVIQRVRNYRELRPPGAIDRRTSKDEIPIFHRSRCLPYGISQD